MEKKLDILKDEEWRDLKEIVLFGYGRQGKRILKTLKKEFDIICIVENSKKKWE